MRNEGGVLRSIFCRFGVCRNLIIELVLGMFGVMLAHPGAIRGLLGTFFLLSWAPFGPSWYLLQLSWGHLDYLGTPVGHLWPSQNSYWAILDLSCACLGPSWAISGPSWVVLGGHLRLVLGRLGHDLACLRHVWGCFGPILGCLGRVLGVSWVVLDHVGWS